MEVPAKPVELPEQKKEEKDPAQVERERVAKKLWDRIPYMTSDYRQLIKYTGGYLAESMTIAYKKGLSDALTLILQSETKEKQ